MSIIKKMREERRYRRVLADSRRLLASRPDLLFTKPLDTKENPMTAPIEVRYVESLTGHTSTPEEIARIADDAHFEDLLDDLAPATPDPILKLDDLDGIKHMTIDDFDRACRAANVEVAVVFGEDR